MKRALILSFWLVLFGCRVEPDVHPQHRGCSYSHWTSYSSGPSFVYECPGGRLYQTNKAPLGAVPTAEVAQ